MAGARSSGIPDFVPFPKGLCSLAIAMLQGLVLEFHVCVVKLYGLYLFSFLSCSWLGIALSATALPNEV
jgi:hypothetical protein